LGARKEFSLGGFAVMLPDLADATAAGLPVSGPVDLGLRIDPAGKVPELNRHDQVGVHAGEDWQALTVVTPITDSGNNHSPASAEVLGDLNGRVSGVLTAGQTDWYQVTVSAKGRLTATVTAPAGSSLVPRLTLRGPGGQVLIQSDDGSLVQHLPPGTYEVAVSARSGVGRYRLTTAVVLASAPFKPFLKGGVPRYSPVVVADVTAAPLHPRRRGRRGRPVLARQSVRGEGETDDGPHVPDADDRELTQALLAHACRSGF
jgi:hypothetical protein